MDASGFTYFLLPDLQFTTLLENIKNTIVPSLVSDNYGYIKLYVHGILEHNVVYTNGCIVYTEDQVLNMTKLSDCRIIIFMY